MPVAYYNELDPSAAEWLRQLIAEGMIAPGDVDERDIKDVKPDDLNGYKQCHFFAGIGGWSYALRLAGWPDDAPVWTGSCPCQPFSVAGKRKGKSDERHVWPEFLRLIAERMPPVCFGEQVASPAGREWLDGVSADLEALGFAFGAADLCAASVNAPHIRQRLWWLADSNGGKSRNRDIQSRGEHGQQSQNSTTCFGLGNTDPQGPQGRDTLRECSDQQSAWSPSVAIECEDGKARRIEPGSFPLAHGIPGRVGLLRGYGNAIVPQVAAEFIGAYLDL